MAYLLKSGVTNMFRGGKTHTIVLIAPGCFRLGIGHTSS